MSPEQSFDERTKKHGGRLETSNLPPKLAHDFEYLRAGSDRLLREMAEGVRLSGKEMSPVHFDYFANDRLNATVFRDPDRYYMGISAGAIPLMRHVFGRALADSSVCPEVGNPLLERSDLPPFERFAPYARDLLARHGEPIVPRDQTRAIFATNYFNHTFAFLFNHEAGHIFQGHVDF
jgi:hypothetical protein